MSRHVDPPNRQASRAPAGFGQALGDAWAQLAAGRGPGEILEDFPDLEPADITAALKYAAAAVQERELSLVTATQ